jgi:hypothetical protein
MRVLPCFAAYLDQGRRAGEAVGEHDADQPVDEGVAVLRGDLATMGWSVRWMGRSVRRTELGTHVEAPLSHNPPKKHAHTHQPPPPEIPPHAPRDDERGDRPLRRRGLPRLHQRDHRVPLVGGVARPQKAPVTEDHEVGGRASVVQEAEGIRVLEPPALLQLLLQEGARLRLPV